MAASSDYVQEGGQLWSIKRMAYEQGDSPLRPTVDFSVQLWTNESASPDHGSEVKSGKTHEDGGRAIPGNVVNGERSREGA